MTDNSFLGANNSKLGASEDLYNQHITGKADPEKSSTGRSGVESGRSQTTDAATIQHGSSSHEDGSKGEAGKSWDSSKSGGASGTMDTSMPDHSSSQNPTSSVGLDKGSSSSSSTVMNTSETPEPQTDGGDFNTGAASVSDASDPSSVGGGLLSSIGSAMSGEKTV